MNNERFFLVLLFWMWGGFGCWETTTFSLPVLYVDGLIYFYIRFGPFFTQHIKQGSNVEVEVFRGERGVKGDWKRFWGLRGLEKVLGVEVVFGRVEVVFGGGLK